MKYYIQCSILLAGRPEKFWVRSKIPMTYFEVKNRINGSAEVRHIILRETPESAIDSVPSSATSLNANNKHFLQCSDNYYSKKRSRGKRDWGIVFWRLVTWSYLHRKILLAQKKYWIVQPKFQTPSLEDKYKRNGPNINIKFEASMVKESSLGPFSVRILSSAAVIFAIRWFQKERPTSLRSAFQKVSSHTYVNKKEFTFTYSPEIPVPIQEIREILTWESVYSENGMSSNEAGLMENSY